MTAASSAPRRLLCIFAHPDDETLAVGSTLAKYAAQGVQTFLLTATRGQHGWQGIPEQDPGPQEMGRIREQELRAAADVLGIHEVTFLDYMDGELDQAPAPKAVARIVAHIRRIRPQVIITFAPDGAYGHPDHIAISQFATAAIVAAADPTFKSSSSLEATHGDAPGDAHRVAKLYYYVESNQLADLYDELVGGLTMEVDGQERGFVGWPQWAITTTIDGDAHWRDVLQAVRSHETQRSTLGTFEEVVEQQHTTLLGIRHYYRAYSLVNSGRKLETDLFEGLN